jgi:acetyl-CoA carboxylase carboxyl transferase subunit alpha
MGLMRMTKDQITIDQLKTLAKQQDMSISDLIEQLEQTEDQMTEREKTPWEIVQTARHKDKPTTIDYIEAIADDFIELHGDRQFKDDQAIVGGIGMIDGIPITIIGHQKGKNIESNIERNFGMAHPEGYRKSLRLMRQAEKFNRPIITFVNTPGAYCGIGAEKRGQSEAIAKNLFEMSHFDVPILSIIIGEGGSGGALALAVANDVWMLDNSIYSILSPEGFSSILYKDASLADQAAKDMKITPKELLKHQLIDRIIEEPIEGAHHNFNGMAKILKKAIINQLKRYAKEDHFKERRYEKFRKIGKFNHSTEKIDRL